MKISVRDMIYILSSFIFCVYAQLVTYGFFGMNIYADKQIYILLFSLSLLLIGVVKLKDFTLNINIFYFSLLIISCIISRLVLKEYSSVTNLIMIYISGSILFRLPIKYYNLFVDVLFFSSIPFMIVLFNHIYNSFAVMNIFIFCVFSLRLINYNKFKLKGILLIAILLIMVLVSFYTQSRTVFFASISVTILIYLLFVKHRKIKNKIITLIILSTTLLLTLIKMDKINYFLNQYFINKWQYNANYYAKSNNFFGLRGYIWEDVLKSKITFFGHERDFFENNYNLRDSHNIFIQTLGVYGLISLILFLLITIVIFLRIIKFKEKNYLVFFLLYYVIGFTENIVFFETRLILISTLFLMNYGMLMQNSGKEQNKV